MGIHDGIEGEIIRGKLKKAEDIEFNGNPHNFNILEIKFIQCLVGKGAIWRSIYGRWNQDGVRGMF